MEQKNKSGKIIGIVLCVIMAAILIIVVFMYRKRSLERAEAIQQRAAALEKIEEEKLDKVVDIYEDMVMNLKMSDIVCWGDGEMAGSDTLSLPKAFKDVVYENLFAPVISEFSAIISLDDRTIPSVEVNNMGVEKEGMNEIMTRAGCYDLKIGEWTVFPADTEPKNVVLMDENSNILHFAEQREARFGQAVINDVEGTLTAGEGEYDEDHPRFAFVRDAEGDSFTAGRGTEVKIASSTKFLGDIPIFFFEDNTAYETDDFVEKLDSLVWWYIEEQEVDASDADEDDSSSEEAAAGETAEEAASGETADNGVTAEAAADGSDAETSAEGSTEESDSEETAPIDAYKFVVICTADEGSDLDEELTGKFGDHYIRNERYAHNMSEDDYKKLAQKVYDLLDEQGFWKSARSTTEASLEELDALSVKTEH